MLHDEGVSLGGSQSCDEDKVYVSPRNVIRKIKETLEY